MDVRLSRHASARNAASPHGMLHEPAPSDRRPVAGPGQAPGQAVAGREHRRRPASWSRASTSRSSRTCTTSARTTPAGCSWRRSRGDMVVLTWLFPRAAFWLLDRDGIKGHFGETQLKPPGATTRTRRAEDAAEPPKGIGAGGRCPGPAHLLPRPARLQQARPVRRGGPPHRRRVPRAGARRRPRDGRSPASCSSGSPAKPAEPNGHARPRRSRRSSCSPPPDRRWYPVIDYSRCTNCLECLDFCLFGVYGVDSLDRILVENQDSARRAARRAAASARSRRSSSPSTSRPAIAGAPVGAISGLKIDLTQAVRRRRRATPCRQAVAGARPRAGRRRPRRGRHGGRHPEAAGGQAAGAEGRPRQADGRPGQPGAVTTNSAADERR